MNYSLFTEDEKKKINDQLGIFGFPTQSNNVGNSYSEDKQKLLDDYELKKEALDSIVQTGDEELDNYADNYNSLGSRAARALQSLGASFQGKDPTAVFNAQQQMKQNDIKNILDRNKNKRDSAYTEAKDVLSRIDNLDKLETDRKKNELEQQRWEKAFERQQNLDQINQSNADRNYNLELQKLNLTKDLQNQKAAQEAALQNQADTDKENLRLEIIDDIRRDIQDENSTYNSHSGLWTSPDEALTKAKLNKINEKIVRFKYPNIKEEQIPEYINKLIKEGQAFDPSDMRRTALKKAEEIGGLKFKNNPNVIKKEYDTDTDEFIYTFDTGEVIREKAQPKK